MLEQQWQTYDGCGVFPFPFQERHMRNLQFKLRKTATGFFSSFLLKRYSLTAISLRLLNIYFGMNRNSFVYLKY